MPKRITDSDAFAFGKRLVALLEASHQPRRGAGAYLAKRYNVATVTANAWLNGEYKPNTGTAKRIADDHGSSFEALYFGEDGAGAERSTDPSETAQDIAELQVLLGMTVQALAASTPIAGRDLAAAIRKRIGPAQGRFADDLVKALESELSEISDTFPRKHSARRPR